MRHVTTFKLGSALQTHLDRVVWAVWRCTLLYTVRHTIRIDLQGLWPPACFLDLQYVPPAWKWGDTTSICHFCQSSNAFTGPTVKRQFPTMECPRPLHSFIIVLPFLPSHGTPISPFTDSEFFTTGRPTEHCVMDSGGTNRHARLTL